MSPVTASQFAAFRLVFGLYLVTLFVWLAPYAGEVFGSSGMLPEARRNWAYHIFPNLLLLADGTRSVVVFVIGLALLAGLFMAGIARRTVAVALWYGWACLYHRNNLIDDPSVPMIGWLLLASALVPCGEGLSLRRIAADPAWEMPSVLWHGAWLILASGYSLSGIHKWLNSPSWVDGSAFNHILQSPLARESFIREWLLAQPPWLGQVLTWSVLALEAAFVPLCLWSPMRFVAWAAMVGMHLGLLLVIDFPTLTFGVLIAHLFVFDRRWISGSNHFTTYQLSE